MAGEPDVTERLVDWLRERGDCRLDQGLTAAELGAAERVLALAVPSGWRDVLLRVHPVALPGSGGRYPDWRDPRGALTRALVTTPVEGVLFDVAENEFWWHAWGPEPDDPARRAAVARERLAGVPRLTPLAGHLYVGPSDDSPVFSIVQTDLYIPALSLPELAELAAPAEPGAVVAGQAGVRVADYPIGEVPFWSELHAYSQLAGTEQRFAALGRGGR